MTRAFFAANYWVGADGPAPAVPTLTVADNENGTGLTATIVTDTGNTVTVYHQRVAGPKVWTSGGSRSGSGTIPITVEPGHYFVHAVATNDGGNASTTVTYAVATDGEAAIVKQILDAVKTRIELLELEDIADSSIVIRKVWLERNIPKPCIVVCHQRTAEQLASNVRDDVSYAILVVLYDLDNQEATYAANLDKYTMWQQKIRRAFRFQYLTGVPEVVGCQIESAEAIIPAAWQQQLFCTALLLRFTSREPRGLT